MTPLQQSLFKQCEVWCLFAQESVNKIIIMPLGVNKVGSRGTGVMTLLVLPHGYSLHGHVDVTEWIVLSVCWSHYSLVPPTCTWQFYKTESDLAFRTLCRGHSEVARAVIFFSILAFWSTALYYMFTGSAHSHVSSESSWQSLTSS